MKLNTYLLRNTSVVHCDVADALSEVEKKHSQHFQWIEIRGKQDRKVPILLTTGMLDSMDLLVKTHQTCGVLDEKKKMSTLRTHTTMAHLASGKLRRSVGPNI